MTRIEQTARLAERVADWFEYRNGSSQLTTGGDEVILKQILRRNFNPYSKIDALASDLAIVTQIHYIAEQGITPQQLRQQAATLRAAIAQAPSSGPQGKDEK